MARGLQINVVPQERSFVERNLLWSDDQKLNYDKIKFYNIPHVTENRSWTGPRVIETTKFEESRSIMEKKYV